MPRFQHRAPSDNGGPQQIILIEKTNDPYQHHHGQQIREDQYRMQQQSSENVGGAIYAPHQMMHHHNLQQLQQPQQRQQLDPSQHVFYGGQQQQSRMSEHQVTGQHIYANSFQQQQPSSPGYSFPPLQYQQGPPQQSQVLQLVNEHQYVNVLPMQGAGAQIMYSQYDGGMPSMAPVVTFMNGHIGGQMSTVRVNQGMPSMDHSQQQHYNPRSSREKVSGRGRRGGPPSRRPDSRHHVHASSCPLLDEFRATKNRDWSVHQIAGHVVEFSQDQNGSRFIQQRLEMGDSCEQQVVVNEVLPAIRSLRNDVFGNYVVQKLLDFGTLAVRTAIRETLQGELLQLSLQMYGCRVIQKVLETLSDDELPGILVEFHHNVLSCIHDQNGNHVVQKCVEVISSRAKRAASQGDEVRAKELNEHIDFIIRDVLVNCCSLSCHPYGCRVLQRMLEHCDGVRKVEILDEILKHQRKLLEDQYGNYVIQHVLQFGRHIDRDSILNIVVESGLLGLSRQKFASNVIEKLLKYGNATQRRAIVREMLKVRSLDRFVAPPYSVIIGI
jgi:pumilio RNA-binding family